MKLIERWLEYSRSCYEIKAAREYLEERKSVELLVIFDDRLRYNKINEADEFSPDVERKLLYSNLILIENAISENNLYVFLKVLESLHEMIEVKYQYKDSAGFNMLHEAVKLEVYTKTPFKYKLTDMQSGIEYTGQCPTTINFNKNWKKL